MTQPHDVSARETQRGRRLQRAFWIFAIALLLRLSIAGVLFAHGFSWGKNEPAAIAKSLVQGSGFSSAFHDTSQPTAWLAPVYPALLACIFRVFGVETLASAVITILLNATFSSLTAVVLLVLCCDQFDRQTGLIAAWAWAISPPLLFMPWLPWETCFSGMLLPFAFTVTLRLVQTTALKLWARCGLIWGFAALVNPALLAPLPVLMVAALRRSRRWAGVVVMGTVCIVSILPWAARNARVLKAFIPIRSNFWPEAYFGNVSFALHPTGDSMLYQKEGEVRYASDLKARTIAFLRSNPEAFWKLTGKRVITFWTEPAGLSPYPFLLLLGALAGIARACRRQKQWLEFAAVMTLYPIIYYATFTFARYRYPIEPLMYALAAYFISEFIRSSRRYRAV